MVERHPVWPHLVAVWLEVFQSQAVTSRDADAGMDAEAGNYGAAPAAGKRKVFHFDLVAGLRNEYAGARAGRKAPGDGSTVKFGEDRLVLRQRVMVLRARMRPQTAALQEPGDTAMDALRQPGEVFIAGRRSAPECKLICFSWRAKKSVTVPGFQVFPVGRLQPAILSRAGLKPGSTCLIC